MATEKEYDEIIAPLLLAAAEKANDLGMSLIARVEWSPDQAGITQIGPMNSIGQKLTQYAAHSRGNVDGMLISLIRSGVDCSQSIFLHKFSPSPDGEASET